MLLQRTLKWLALENDENRRTTKKKVWTEVIEFRSTNKMGKQNFVWYCNKSNLEQFLNYNKKTYEGDAETDEDI